MLWGVAIVVVGLLSIILLRRGDPQQPQTTWAVGPRAHVRSQNSLRAPVNKKPRPTPRLQGEMVRGASLHAPMVSHNPYHSYQRFSSMWGRIGGGGFVCEVPEQPKSGQDPASGHRGRKLARKPSASLMRAEQKCPLKVLGHNSAPRSRRGTRIGGHNSKKPPGAL